MTMNDTELNTAVELLTKAAADLKAAGDALLRCITSEDAPAAEPKPAVDKDTLRARLTRLVNDGHMDVVQTFFANYNAKKLSEVPESRYADLYMDIEEFENACAK